MTLVFQDCSTSYTKLDWPAQKSKNLNYFDIYLLVIVAFYNKRHVTETCSSEAINLIAVETSSPPPKFLHGTQNDI